MAIQITPGIVAAGLTALVAQEGEDYVYEQGESGRCDYVRDGKPSCIIGRFLADLGVSLERLKLADEPVSGTAALTLLEELQDEGVVDPLILKVIKALGTAQCKQDNEYPWGVAVECALEGL